MESINTPHSLDCPPLEQCLVSTPSSQSGVTHPGAALEERVASLETALATVLERVAVLEAGAPLALPRATPEATPSILVEPPPALPSGVRSWA